VLRDVGRTSLVLSRQIGGLVSRRDSPRSGRDLLEPLPAIQQRAALEMLIDHILSPHALPLPARLQRRLAPDFFDRAEGVLDANGVPIRTDFSLADELNRLRRTVLISLMSEDMATRMLDNIDKSRDNEPSPLTVRELHRRLRAAIWPASASKEADLVAPWARNLQRDHVNLLSMSVLRGSDRADVRAQMRQQARALVQQLQGSLKGDPDSTEQAHRRDCLETLQRALAATVLRSTP
jgi:Met-zincin